MLIFRQSSRQDTLLVPQDNLSIDNKMIEPAAKLREEAIKNVIGLKRTAPDDLPKLTGLENTASQMWLLSGRQTRRAPKFGC